MTLLQIPGAPTTPDVLPDSVPPAHDQLAMLKDLPVDELLSRLVSGLVSLAFNIALAILVFYVGKFLIGKIYGLISRILERRKVEASLTTFTLSLVNVLLYFILIVTVIGILGIETTSFIALFTSAGVALGMALSGTLQNFAGGVLILLLKPYRIGDYIETQGFAGTVKEIQMFNTIITTPDNKAILLPNGALSTSSINNYSREEFRRVDWTVSISYGDNVDTAIKALLEIANADPRTEKNDHDEPKVVVTALAASSVDLRLSVWTKSANYWGIFFDLNKKIYEELPKAGINFPFAQLSVHVEK